MKESVYSICGMCTVRCPIKVDIEDGMVKWIEGNPNDPGMAGRLCAKGNAALEIINHPERLTHPLKKTKNNWIQIEWEDALDLVADRLSDIIRSNSPDTLGFLASAKCTNEENYLFQKLVRMLGTNNVDHCARL